mgnify:FL=1
MREQTFAALCTKISYVDGADLGRFWANDRFFYAVLAAKRGMGGLRLFVAVVIWQTLSKKTAIFLCLSNTRTLSNRA